MKKTLFAVAVAMSLSACQPAPSLEEAYTPSEEEVHHAKVEYAIDELTTKFAEVQCPEEVYNDDNYSCGDYRLANGLSIANNAIGDDSLTRVVVWFALAEKLAERNDPLKHTLADVIETCENLGKTVTDVLTSYSIDVKSVCEHYESQRLQSI